MNESAGLLLAGAAWWQSGRLASSDAEPQDRASTSGSGGRMVDLLLNKFVSALGGTLKLTADFGDEQLKIA